MSGTKQIALFVLGLALAGYFAARIASETFIKRSCVTFPTLTSKSPSGSRVAILNREHCTDDPMPKAVVWIGQDGAHSSPHRWSVFIAKLPPLEAVPESKIPYKIGLTWISDDKLDIAYPRGTPLESSPGSSNGVEVFYSEQRPAAKQ